MKFYIVTNTTQIGNYTPSVFTKKENAVQWLKELAADNIKSAYEDELKEGFEDLYGSDDLDFEGSIEAILEFADENLDNVEIYTNEIDIYYADDSFNIIQLFEVETE